MTVSKSIDTVIIIFSDSHALYDSVVCSARLSGKFDILRTRYIYLNDIYLNVINNDAQQVKLYVYELDINR